MADLFEGLNLPQSSYLPQEYSRQALEQIDIGQQRAEEESMRRFLEGINAMGRLYTGSALRGGIEQLLGPALERRQQLLGGLAMQGLEAQRGERLTGEQRQYESGERSLDRQFQAQQAELQRALQERMFATQMAEQRRAARTGRRLSTQMEGMVAPALQGGLAYGLGGLPGLMFSGGGGGLPNIPENNFVMANRRNPSTFNYEDYIYG